MGRGQRKTFNFELELNAHLSKQAHIDKIMNRDGDDDGIDDNNNNDDDDGDDGDDGNAGDGGDGGSQWSHFTKLGRYEYIFCPHFCSTALLGRQLSKPSILQGSRRRLPC